MRGKANPVQGGTVFQVLFPTAVFTAALPLCQDTDTVIHLETSPRTQSLRWTFF